MVRRWLVVIATVVGMPLSMASFCETTSPDMVTGKRDPQRSGKGCWALQIALDGRDDKTQIKCVTKEVWDDYKVGDKFPHAD